MSLKQILEEVKEGTTFLKMQPFRCFQIIQPTTATISIKTFAKDILRVLKHVEEVKIEVPLDARVVPAI
jgi:hypothetical protein